MVKENAQFHANEVEYKIYYPNSAILYITNNNIDGSKLNLENRINANLGQYAKQHSFDTLTVSGTLNNELVWKECVLGDVVVGYLGVKKQDKELYDNSLESIQFLK